MGRHPRVDEVGDRGRNTLRLCPIIVVGPIGDLGAALALARQAHRTLALGRVSQDVVRQAHDLRSRTVVAGQLHDASTRMLAPKTRQVIRGRPREGINGLRDIADDAHIVATAQPQVEQTGLEEVDILELVNHEGAVLLAHDGGDVRAFLQHAAQVDEDVLEVDDTALVLRILIHVEEARHVGRVQPGGHVTPQASHTRRVVRGVDHRHLRPFDLGRDIANVRAVDRDPQASS